MASNLVGKLTIPLRNLVTRNLRTTFAIVRNTMPIIVIGRRFALVTRAADVKEVMGNDDAFMVTYETRMRVVTGGENFFLGMGDTPDYHCDVTNWRDVFNAQDLDTIVTPVITGATNAVMDASTGSIDVIADLAGIVPTALVESYMGVTGFTHAELVNWTTKLFGYLFFPSKPGPETDEAERLAAIARTHIDELIAARKQSGDEVDDGIGRALKMQAQGRERMTDLDIRNNLLGIVIGAVPTTSKCVGLVIDHLLEHPDHLEDAKNAAKAGEWDTVNGYVNECLRFAPFGPAVLRECRRDYKVAKGTMRSRTIKKGTTVAVATLSAMWDRRAVDNPESFNPKRPDATYLTFGEGMHRCFGARINSVQIARIVGAVVMKDNLTRAADKTGRLEYDGQFPIHLRLTFTP